MPCVDTASPYHRKMGDFPPAIGFKTWTDRRTYRA